ncbi:MAG: VacB/RNase II family 3'-5' exoribonuclease [Oscillospiraceae bacterium]|nr:VacB/RNase II family 3'-5' exoribonuclease [Oscillospiraceae bacterium]
MPKSRNKGKGNKKNSNKAAGRKAKAALTFKGEIIRVGRTHGFIRQLPDDSHKKKSLRTTKDSELKEFFASGRDLLGAVVGDVVLFVKVALPRETGGLHEVKVTQVLKTSDNLLTGTIVKDNESGDLCLSPDSFGSRYPLKIASWGGNKLKEGDKVSFALKSRGAKHHLHIAEITGVYGASDNARVCVKAYLEEKRISTVFSSECEEEAADCGDVIDAREVPNRTDLRDLPIFTIDGSDTKDIDDAVHIERTSGGYRLGVHIADVSHYVTDKSALDEEAFSRGTSVYIADLVVPMLPKALSNGICSLNPDVDRLAFSCLMEVAKSGELKSFEFKKTVIRSRLQGVYREINAILASEFPTEYDKKYAEVSEQLPIMNELAATLKKNRAGRNAPALESAETKIVCDENGKCVDVVRRESGGNAVSEGIIEEFMLLANNAAARLAMQNNLPFVYRVHEEPAAEKLTRLSETLTGLGFSLPALKPTAESLSGVLEAAKKLDESKFDVVNMAVLRSMMKAKYSEEPLGHFGLVMKEYAHFTSPIRRYPDLSIHRILSQYVTGNDSKLKKYGKFAHESALKSTFNEQKAVNAERDCNGFYIAEYMTSHVGEEFDGVITGMTENSIFVSLANTVEGRVSFRSTTGRFAGLAGETTLENGVTLANSVTGVRYTLGDSVRVKCVSCSVPMGTVDFEMV